MYRRGYAQRAAVPMGPGAPAMKYKTITDPDGSQIMVPPGAAGNFGGQQRPSRLMSGVRSSGQARPGSNWTMGERAAAGAYGGLSAGPQGAAANAATVGLASASGLNLPSMHTPQQRAALGLGGAPRPGGAGARPPAPSAASQAMTNMFNQQMNLNMKQRGDLQDIGQGNIAALQRRNASNAALAGRSIGGGYLGGQRAMLTQGLGQMNKDLLANDAQRQQLMSAQLERELQQSNRAEDRQNQLSDRDAGWEREDTLREADAKANQDKAIRESYADAYKKAFQSGIGDPNHRNNAWVIDQLNRYIATGDESIKQYLDEYLAGHRNETQELISGYSA